MMMEGTQGGSNPIPTGERVLGGLRTYFAGFTRGTTGSTSAVVLACDVSGYEDPNIREFANKIAENGYYVVVPDFCRGDPFVPDPSGGRRPLAAWLEDHDPSEDAFEDAKVVSNVLSHFHPGVGAIGIGWGAKVVSELATATNFNYYVNLIVLLDPLSVTLDDLKGGEVPILMFGAELNHDHASPQPHQPLEEIPNSLSTVPELVKLVPGTVNGWRHNPDDKEAAESEKVVNCILDWFSKGIKMNPLQRKFAGIVL